MNLEEINRTESCILVEGPRWADTTFYAKWLLAAAKTEALWKKALSDPVFKKQIERLLIAEIPDFNIGATVMLSRFKKHLASITIDLASMDVEEFAIMVGMGFFVLTGRRYQMVVPTKMGINKLKRAALRLADTEDDNYDLHPEHILATMPDAEAKSWQVRLRGMDEDHRCADRILALSAKSFIDRERRACICWADPSVLRAS